MARVRPAEITEELNDVWRLVVGYTKQEAVAPLRGIGAFMRWGVVGMVLFALGTGFGVMAIVRALETETDTALTGYWSWVPYFAATAWVVIVGVLSARSLAHTPWKKKGDAQ
jgi:uncharacterized membrane protein